MVRCGVGDSIMEDKELDKSFFNMAYGMIIYTEILIFTFIYTIQIITAILMRLRL